MADTKKASSGSVQRQRKAAARELLRVRDLDKLRKWMRNSQNPFRTLMSLLFDTDELICWRAVEALGIAAGIVAERNLENVRKLIRRLLWTMNDESGSICWYAPQAIGEVLVHVPGLIDEYGPLLPAYLEEEPFGSGTHWAIARVASIRPDIYEDDVDRLVQSLDNPDPNIRGYALMALKWINAQAVKSKADRFKSDTASVSIYDSERGIIVEIGVLELAQALVAAT